MKKWYQSKTIIFNGIIAIIAGFSQISGLFTKDVFHSLGIDSEKFLTAFGLAVAIVNVYLRNQTSKAIGKDSQ